MTTDARRPAAGPEPRPRTWLCLPAAGRSALEAHLAALVAITRTHP